MALNSASILNNPRPYVAGDLLGLNRNELIQLVRMQPTCWPENVSFNTKTNKRTLSSVLLDASNGYSTTNPASQPASTSEVQPVTSTVTQAGPAAVSSSDSTGIEKTIEVFIRDHRVTPPSWESVELKLQLYPSAAGDDGWYISGRELMVKVQQTFSPIRGQGIVRVGIPNQHAAQYAQIFVEAVPSQLPTAPMNPEHLRIPPFNTPFPCITIKIYGSPLNPTLTSPNITNENNSSDDDDMGSDTDSDSNSDMIYLSEDETKLVAKKLAIIAKSCAAFDNVKASIRSRSLKNTEIIKVWEFRATFFNQYYKQSCSSVVDEPNVQGKEITARCICKALGISYTTMTQARKGMRLIERHAWGPAAPDAVIAEILKERPGGRLELLDFLQKWEASHP
ncbi:hypothetical protein H0H93_000863 [Arthromyces matolae]|nr:hypothetical protein H0H93_000863 [Arthromyces matolae]